MVAASANDFNFELPLSASSSEVAPTEAVTLTSAPVEGVDVEVDEADLTAYSVYWMV